jgi:hypothetical protein
MSIIEKQYHYEDHVFVYNNATIHTKLPKNAPNVNKLTLGLSQKVKYKEAGLLGEMITCKYPPVTLLDGRVQQLYHPSKHPITKLCGAFKGMSLNLEEWGIPSAQNLKLVCPLTGFFKQGCPIGSTNCCA